MAVELCSNSLSNWPLWSTNLPVIDIFIHHRGGRNEKKKNNDNNNNNIKEESNLTNLTNFQ